MSRPMNPVAIVLRGMLLFAVGGAWLGLMLSLPLIGVLHPIYVWLYEHCYVWSMMPHRELLLLSSLGLFTGSVLGLRLSLMELRRQPPAAKSAGVRRPTSTSGDASVKGECVQNAGKSVRFGPASLALELLSMFVETIVELAIWLVWLLATALLGYMLGEFSAELLYNGLGEVFGFYSLPRVTLTLVVSTLISIACYYWSVRRYAPSRKGNWHMAWFAFLSAFFVFGWYGVYCHWRFLQH